MLDRRKTIPRLSDEDIDRIAGRIIEELEERLERRAGRSLITAIWTVIVLICGAILAKMRGWL